MSPITRLFIVLNLGLAGTFVGFASTYLQSAADSQAELVKVKTESQSTIDGKDSEIAALQRDLNDEKRKSGLSAQKLTQAETGNKQLSEENQTLKSQLADIQGNIQTINNSLVAMGDTVSTAAENASQARDAHLAAVTEKDDAVRAADAASANVNDLTATNNNLKSQLSALEAHVAKLQSDLDAARSVADPRLLGLGAQPELVGTVNRVDASGRSLTIAITDNPEGADVTPGVRFAVFNDGIYKGEATIDQVEGNQAVCLFEGPNSAPPVRAGARAGYYLVRPWEYDCFFVQP